MTVSSSQLRGHLGWVDLGHGWSSCLASAPPLALLDQICNAGPAEVATAEITRICRHEEFHSKVEHQHLRKKQTIKIISWQQCEAFQISKHDPFKYFFFLKLGEYIWQEMKSIRKGLGVLCCTNPIHCPDCSTQSKGNRFEISDLFSASSVVFG